MAVMAPSQNIGVASEAPAHLRYQFKPYTGSSHSWAIRVLEGLPSTSRVLDIGPGSGAIGQALKGLGWSALDAVEIDPAAREHVRPIYRNVAESLSAFTAERYDVVLLLDVIEHMARPESFIREVAQLVASGGILLVSVPNIAHWSTRFGLLVGQFKYTERGLLDKTHLQFFTRRRVREISMAVPELRMESTASSIEPIELLSQRINWRSSFFENLRKLRLWIAQTLPGLFAFQHLAVFRKS